MTHPDRPRKMNLAELMKRADWDWWRSDDIGVRQKGQTEIFRILEDIWQLAKTDKEQAQRLWQEYAPKDFFVPDCLR